MKENKGKKLYGAVVNGKLVGIHEDLAIVKKFLAEEVPTEKDWDIIVIKKKAAIKMEDTEEYYDLYLTRIKDRVLPHKYCMNQFYLERKYDLKYCLEILDRTMKETDLSSKEEKSFLRVINVIKSEMDNLEPPPYECCVMDEELDNEFKRIFEK